MIEVSSILKVVEACKRQKTLAIANPYGRVIYIVPQHLRSCTSTHCFQYHTCETHLISVSKDGMVCITKVA